MEISSRRYEANFFIRMKAIVRRLMASTVSQVNSPASTATPQPGPNTRYRSSSSMDSFQPNPLAHTP